ncbi:MAG: hypothetical protein MUP70_05625 [Candidatus Aminicenantes bacterium]|nr:hypothetical protein [Candidatus Aminicenantes bacterium]
MNIGNKDIRRLYQTYLDKNRPADRKRCPQREDIFRLFTKRIPFFRRKKILNHILDCPFCKKDLKTMAGLFRFSNDIVTSAEALLQKPQKNTVRRLRFLSVSPLARFVVISSILILFSSIATVIFLKSGKMVLRSVKMGDSLILQTYKVKYTGEKALLFSWQKADEADHYIFELYKDDLSLLWRSGPIETNSLILPGPVSGKMDRKQKHYWTITAHFKNGSFIESDLVVLK